MSKSNLLRKLNKALSPDKVDFSGIDQELNNLKKKLQETVNIQTLDDVSQKLKQFQSKIDFLPVLSELSNIKAIYEKHVSNTEQKIKDIESEIKSTDNEKTLTNLKKEAESLRVELDNVKALIPSLSPINDSLKKLDDARKAFTEQLNNLSERQATYSTKEDSSKSIGEVNKAINEVRETLLTRISSLGGGAMNRQMKVEGVDVLTRYTDMNFKGSGVTISATNNNTTKNVDITFTASGGGTPGGSNTQVQFNDSGTFGGSSGLTFVKGTNILSVTGGVALPNNISITGATATIGGPFGIGKINTSNELLIDPDARGTRFGGLLLNPAVANSVYITGASASIGGPFKMVGVNANSTVSVDGDGRGIVTGAQIMLVGETSAFPSIKRSGTTLKVRLADDSADAPLTASNITSSGVYLAANGLSGTPSYSFTNDPNTGLYSYGANQLGITAGGSLGIYLTTALVEFEHNVSVLGSLTVNKNAGNFIGLSTTTTSQVYGSWQNGTGQIYFGVESSTGGTIFTGTAAYSSVFGSSNASSLHFATNNTVGFTMDSSQNIALISKINKYNNITTAGWGVPAIYGSGRATGQTAANTSVATYTVGAADGSFEVSANVLVTTSSAENFTTTVAYTDEGNTARTLTLNFQTIAATIGTAINFANGAVPYEGLVVHIRAKASTAITVKTSGTFTGCTYNVEGIIKQTS